MGDTQPLNSVANPHVAFPHGYKYGVTRGADLILQGAHPTRFADLCDVLAGSTFKVADMVAAGGGRSQIAVAWDGGLKARGWGKRNVSVKRVVDDEYVSSARSHEIDMFGPKSSSGIPYPGVACELEWSNKDPFFDRDLSAMAVFHAEGIIDLGVIVTRGPTLHEVIRRTIPGAFNVKRGRYELKYGETTTHWNKLIPRIERGGGGGCPLILIGIEPPRFDHEQQLIDVAATASALHAAGDIEALNDLHRRVQEEGLIS